MVSQLLLRGLDGRTRVLRFPRAERVACADVLHAAAAACALPPGGFRLVTGAAEVTPHGAPLRVDAHGLLPSCTVLLRLCGGKGGFGANLRGAGKGGRITNNDDACRDLSGRRMRIANAEAKLQEWKARARARAGYRPSGHAPHNPNDTGSHGARPLPARRAPTRRTRRTASWRSWRRRTCAKRRARRRALRTSRALRRRRWRETTLRWSRLWRAPWSAA